MSRVDPTLLHELKEYGAVGIEKCFNCGNCTAICPLASDEYPFPRSVIRRAQIGDKERMKSQLDPWLCYYCGDCSATCPKGAEPGETMMASRRWLTGQYDWTGLARKFYTSLAWELGSIILVGLLVVWIIAMFHGPLVTERVELNTFAPLHIVHLADWVMAGALVFFIATNVLRMYWLTMRRDGQKIPFKFYVTEAWQLVLHALTQKRWATCAADEKDEKTRNAKRTARTIHLLLVSGYGLMLVLIIFFLSWFQTDNIYPLWHPQRWLGYYATVVLLLGAGWALWGRVKKEVEMHRFSHPSDWIFPILLLVVTLTGILQHAFRYWDMPLATYYTYVVHLAFTAPMLILEVPFGKWAHLYYRPLAVYFQAVKEKAKAEQQVPEGALAAAD
ncbi:MAG: 4Fe-4S dicluster domain-containing protein [Anaerolineaceae bacterium]|nr:MAG: 4Fe-4S dicluster domain-containing protein [Anaerolineaceae bacterium]